MFTWGINEAKIKHQSNELYLVKAACVAQDAWMHVQAKVGIFTNTSVSTAVTTFNVHPT